MKIAIIQTRPIVGDIDGNVDRHVQLAHMAADHHAELVVFPELSLSGYDPTLAAKLAVAPTDQRFRSIQEICDQTRISVWAGAPTVQSGLPRISTLVFGPNRIPQVYSKRFLHPDELPYFNTGPNCPNIIYDRPAIALAICFELSVPEHAIAAHQAGAKAYVVSAAKTAKGIADAQSRLSEIAAEFQIPVFISNSLGLQGNEDCSGNSSAWNSCGKQTQCLNGEEEGMILYNIKSAESQAFTA